jgi:hypothetical protein
MHPSQRIYCTKSEKLKGKKIVLGITGSIALHSWSESAA